MHTPAMSGYQSVTVDPNVWKNGSDARIASLFFASSSSRNCETFPRTLQWLIIAPLGSPVVPLVKSNTASACPPFFGMFSKRKSKRAGKIIDMIHHKIIWRFNCGISSSSFKTRSGHGKSFTRLMNGVAEIATRRLARLQQDSLAARHLVVFRSKGTLFGYI